MFIIVSADIIKIIDAITDRDAPVLANRVLQYTSKFFKWCIGRGYIEHNPAANIPKPAKESSRERVLSLAEARSIYQAAEWPRAHYLRLCKAPYADRPKTLRDKPS